MAVYEPASGTRTLQVAVVTATITADRRWGIPGDVVVFSGTITQNGTPVVGADVALFIRGVFDIVASTVTGADGSYSFTFTLPWNIGATWLAGADQEFGITSPVIEPGTEPTTWVAIAYPTRISNFLAPDTVAPGVSFTVTGVLQYESSVDVWAALDGRTVNIYYNTTLLGSVTTAPDGSFSLTTTIPTAGAYTLTAEFLGENIPAGTAAYTAAYKPSAVAVAQRKIQVKATSRRVYDFGR